MKADFSYSTKILKFIDDNGVTLISYHADSYVRNELNGERKIGVPGDVEYTVTKDRTIGKPYMPRPCPIGEWTIIGKEPTTNKWMQPIRFLLDAHQTVKVWETGPEGYIKETNETTEDYGYRIHFNNGSVHSDGCITTLLEMIRWMDKNVMFPCRISVRE